MLRFFAFGRTLNDISRFGNIKTAVRSKVISPSSGCNHISSSRGFYTSNTQFARIQGAKTNGISESGLRFDSLIKPFVLTISVGCISYTAATIWQYEHVRRMILRNKARLEHFRKPNRNDLEKWWNKHTPGMKAVLSIIGANFVVFAMWRILPLHAMMRKYFVSSPMGAAPCSSLLLSSFSHNSVFHFLANMYVLHSFAPAITNLLGPEQFVATYMTAAAVSGFGSYVYKVVRNSRVPSLGASGAIIAILGMVCAKYPDGRLSIAFVDQIFPHSFSADSAMKGLILMDTLGVLLGWRFFDHAAHLSGMFFGLWYIHYGHKIFKEKREVIAKKWHSIRSKWSEN